MYPGCSFGEIFIFAIVYELYCAEKYQILQYLQIYLKQNVYILPGEQSKHILS